MTKVSVFLRCIPLCISLLFCSSFSSFANSGEMRFVFVPPSKMHALLRGAKWKVYADGPIDVNAADRFEQLIKKKNVPQYSTIYLNSSGGSVIAGIGLGKLFRKYGFRTSLGRYAPNSDYPLWDAHCLSACTFAYIGAEFRYMSKESVFGVHRFYSAGRTLGSEDAAQILSGYIVQHLSSSGIDPTFFIKMTKAGPKEIYILSMSELEKMGVVNNGIGKTTWSIASLPSQGNPLYLKGERKTQRGINKFMVICHPGIGLELYVIFDPQGRQKEVMQMGAQSLSIDRQTIPFREHLYGEPKIANGWLNAAYLLPETIIEKISTAETVGFMFQHVYKAPVFLGFQGMTFEGGRQMFRGLRSSCTK